MKGCLLMKVEWIKLRNKWFRCDLISCFYETAEGIMLNVGGMAHILRYDNDYEALKADLNRLYTKLEIE